MAEVTLNKEEVITSLSLTLSAKEAFFLKTLLGRVGIRGPWGSLSSKIFHLLDNFVEGDSTTSEVLGKIEVIHCSMEDDSTVRFIKI